MEESLSLEHSGELLGDPLEQLLDGGRVADEGGSHLDTAGWDVTHGGLHVVGDPFHEVGGVLALNIVHLLVHFLHGHLTSEHGGHGEVAAVAGVARSHHVLGIEHLLGEFGHGEGAVLLRPAGGERGKARHEEVETREGHHVNGKLPEIGVELARESQAGGDAGHSERHQMVKVTVGWVGQLERAEANIVKSFVVDAVRLIGVLDELVDG